jgi:catechol 2,3-dioxygenase-like lactoylglutathione lyase family enzyme
VSDANRFSRDVIIRTGQFSSAIEFYSSVLGLPVTHRSPSIVGFETGSFQLFVERGPQHAPVFELLVSDVAVAKAKLLAAGCTLVEEDAALPRCYVRDPYGITFNIGECSGQDGGVAAAGRA